MTKEKKPATIHSADDLIVKMEAEKLGKVIPEIPNELPELVQDKTPPEAKAKDSQEQASDDSQNIEDTQASEESTEEQPEADSKEASNDSSDGNVDEYGNTIGKPKLYTEEEVQSMIRDRLKRGKHAEPEVVQQAAKDFTPDPDSDESWEQQLESFIDRTIEKRESKRANEEWQREEKQTQAEFETKFTQGMEKYKDFSQIVANKPITNAMMLATRSMKDPAAFIYAAAKQQPKELERIAGIKDPVHQATEIGRLEERMKKARAIPASPKPSSKIKGDTSSELPQIGIDQRIAAHAKTKIMSRR